jgi:Tfp pilus assembly protein PilP
MPDIIKSKRRTAGLVCLSLLLVLGPAWWSGAAYGQQGGLDLQVEVNTGQQTGAAPPFPGGAPAYDPQAAGQPTPSAPPAYGAVQPGYDQQGQAPAYGVQQGQAPAYPSGGIDPAAFGQAPPPPPGQDFGAPGQYPGAPGGEYGVPGQGAIGIGSPDGGFNAPGSFEDFPNVPADAPPPVPPTLSDTSGNVPEEPAEPLTPEEQAKHEARTETYSKLQQWHNSIMAGYAFSTTLLFDPFMPIESVARPPEVETKKDEDLRKKPMIQRLALNQFVLSAIIVAADPNETSALVDNGGRGYILKRGTLIGPNNGYVKEITQSRVVIEEPEVNYMGETRLRETVMSLELVDDENMTDFGDFPD